MKLKNTPLGLSADPPPLYLLRLYFDNDEMKRRQIGPFYAQDAAKAAVDCLESGQSQWSEVHKMTVYCNGEVISNLQFYVPTSSVDNLIVQLSKIIDP